jgi:hypothetical protein
MADKKKTVTLRVDVDPIEVEVPANFGDWNDDKQEEWMGNWLVNNEDEVINAIGFMSY